MKAISLAVPPQWVQCRTSIEKHQGVEFLVEDEGVLVAGCQLDRLLGRPSPDLLDSERRALERQQAEERQQGATDG